MLWSNFIIEDTVGEVRVGIRDGRGKGQAWLRLKVSQRGGFLRFLAVETWDLMTTFFLHLLEISWDY